MEKLIRVRVLGREYPLRVRIEDEANTRAFAAYVDMKMKAFRRDHPEQTETTTAVITALALAEELFAARSDTEHFHQSLSANLDTLESQLTDALTS